MVTGRRRGLPRAEQVAKNREDLLDAAGRVFRELGYSGASLDGIAEAAGFSKGAVYSHFANKADLFLTLLESRIEERTRHQLEAAEQPPPDGGPVEFIAQAFTVSRQDPRWQLAVLEFRVVAARDPELAARYAIAHRRTIDGITAALRALFASLGVEPELPIQKLAVAGLMIDAGWYFEDIAAPESIPVLDVAEFFVRLMGLTISANKGA